MPKPQVKFIPVMLSRSEALRLFVLTLRDKERERLYERYHTRDKIFAAYKFLDSKEEELKEKEGKIKCQ